MYVVELYVHTPGRDGVDVIMVMETSFYFSLSLAHTRYRGRGVIKAACGNETKVDDLFFSFSPLTEKRRHESTQVPSCRVNATLMIACCVPVDVFSSASRSTSCSRDDGTKRDEELVFPLCIGTAEINSRREENRK